MGQADAPLTGQSQQLNQGQAQVATATGTATWTFQSPGPGSTFTGTMSCLSAPPTAVFIATIGGTSWGDWAGDSVAGPMQAFGTQQIVVNASGLSAGTTYELWWIGSSDPSSSVASVWPDVNTSAQTVLFGAPSVLVAGSSTVVNSSGPPVLYSFQVPMIPPTVRTLLLNLKAVTSGGGVTGNAFFTVTIQGNQSGYDYYNQTPYLQQSPGSLTQLGAIIICPILVLFDTSLTITVNYGLTSLGGTTTIVGTYSMSGDTAIYDESVLYNGPIQAAGIALAAPATTTLLDGPARILSATLEAISPGATAEFVLAGSQQLARADSTAGSTVPFSVSVPVLDNFLLPYGKSLALSSGGVAGTFAGASVSWAFP